MIFNKDQLVKPFKANLLISVIANEADQNHIKSFFQEQIDHIYSSIVSINCLSSVDEFKIEKPRTKNFNEKGLINTYWLHKMMTIKTSVCIIVNQCKSDVSFREEEKKWLKDIQKIKAASPETVIYLIILTGTIPSPSDSEERSDSIYKQRDIKAVYTFTSLEAIKKSSEVRKIHMNVINSSKDYYRTLKQKYIRKINDLSIKNEIRIKSYIKIGILAWIKNKKLTSKHFEKAYKLLFDYNENDIRKYPYGNDPLLNFCEIRAAADWLFYKIYYINNIKNKGSKASFIIRANQHYNKFCSNIFIDNTDEHYYYIIDLYWCYTFNEFVGSGTSANIDTVVISKNFSGFYYLKGVYSLKRIMNQLPLFENMILNNVVIDNKKLSVDALKKVNSKYYEKPTIFIDDKDILNQIHIPFNIELYFRYFLLENNINLTALKDKITQQLLPNIMNTFQSQISFANKLKQTDDIIPSTYTPSDVSNDAKLNKSQNSTFNTINFYLNAINLPLYIQEYQTADITKLHQLMLSSKTLWKYPIVYYSYLEKVIQLWMTVPSLSLQEKGKLFKSLILLGNNRDLTDKEEEIFLRLLSDQELKESDALKSPISLKVNNKDDSINRLFNIEHTIIGDNKVRNILELVDFEFTIKTSLKSKPIKFASITVYFGYEKRYKEFTQFDNELTNSTSLTLNYQILLKANEQGLMLKKIAFKVEDFPFVFEYVIHSKKENVVLVKQSKKKVLEFNLPKIVKIGVNQYYRIKCDIVKDENANVDIGSIAIDFEKKISMSDILTKAPSIQSQLNTSLPVSSSVSIPSKSSSSSMKSSFEKASIGTSMKSAFENPTTGSSMRSTFEQLANTNLNPLASIPQSTKLSDILKASSSSTIISQSQPQFQATPQEIPQSQSIQETVPEYYILEEDGSIAKKEDKVTFKIDHYESSNKSISFLIKFNTIGRSTIGFSAKYHIIKKEFTDDQVESRETGRMIFEIINPFEFKYNIESNIYMTYHSKPQFNTNSIIKLSLAIKNLLDSDISINSLNIEPTTDAIQIKTPITKVLSMPKAINESVLTIMKSSTYIIPFEVFYSSEANGVCGYCDLNWSTNDLQSFSDNMTNCKRFELPEITAFDFSFDISYVVLSEVSINSNFDLIIRIQNREKEFKRIILLIDTSNEFAIVGKLKHKMLLYPNEIKDVSFKMIPMTHGKIKLPSCKITLFPIQKYDGKIYSIYYLPDYIVIKP